MLISAGILLISCIGASAQQSWYWEHSAAKSIITRAKLERHLEFLSDTLCQGRATGTRGSVEAAFWICRQFEKAGLLKFGDTYSKHFLTKNGITGNNIMGMLPASKDGSFISDKYVIIGAHYDHLGILNGKLYPGADANASGTVAMTSIAEMMSARHINGKIYSCNIIFIAFDCKEMSRAGSEAVWQLIESGQLADPITGKAITKKNISLMVNIDQIGSVLSPLNPDRKDYLIMLGSETLPKIHRSTSTICNRMFALHLDLGFSYYGSKNFTDLFYRLSDQNIFIKNKIPAILFTSGITMNNNKTYDNVESLDIEVFQKRIFLIYHWLDRIL
ncbi:MAG: M28 family peptidase [Bacteroidales bacterium]|nr:M28 family peptidase [Bacteroidales bacterium]